MAAQVSPSLRSPSLHDSSTTVRLLYLLAPGLSDEPLTLAASYSVLMTLHSAPTV